METWKPNNNVVLCLNGHSIAANGDFVVIEIDKGQFTLCDCNSSESMHYFTTSKEGLFTRWVPCEENTENRISVTGGVITHSVGRSDLGVKVDNNATFTMYGGTICGNKLQGSYNGAGVYVHNSTFNMYGGAIRGNAASWGGGVAALGSTFNMYGGVISDNMVSASAGGVLLSDKSVMNMSGNAQIVTTLLPPNGRHQVAECIYLPALTEKSVTAYICPIMRKSAAIQPPKEVLCMYVKTVRLP